ncbi:hypothetical protein K450DRAFT_223883 [Umbelopsis ramanniana AG]|uniref:P-loop containing nucleoside triphosphate hydrolase protein n=1 Tax=Umbelopsis ramanniana AG TaxID=1314678 RepID=A0AAD5EHS6_UMBRA|nr:uncharacterized protein K450DRAFT_223883 [Umbelopsis ramanniana AG]KAI8583474.1 hypothetical protein K450DRAFT_223883 [Umbelopsis ramanniana AG]
MAATTAQQSLEVFTKGTKAWFTDEKEGWVSATLTSKSVDGDKIKLLFRDDNDDKEHVFESTLAQIEKSNGSSLPPLRNPPKMEYTDDLTNLSYLNEPAVLNTIRTRYLQRIIYTYSGIVLIAVNPFDRVSLYEPDIIQQYSGKRRGELEPHLFAIAEDAYRCMIREQSNQTIVVSGESGAGKTVSAKYIMRYFATADGNDNDQVKAKAEGSGMTEVEEQILATNPIMEAFGNAKTTRNDNSSRFGKYIEIQFNESADIIGAKIRTYLLERSRLIFQPETERNYHIFYQLCAGIPSNEKKDFELGDFTKFHYLNQSGTGTIPGVDDASEFEVTQRSLSTIGISVQVQWQIFRVLAALLHIGNIQITGRGDAMLNETDQSLVTATRLLGIKAAEFRKWVVRKQIITRSEKIVTNLNPTQANVVKDSVAKYIYANLFEWLVGVINDSLSSPDISAISTFIGVLDIYGFEHFKKNSFEQFCINYANEKLQQQFNQHVFKLEQEEYIREKINWTFIDFSDNQKCIEMIEGKLGILSLLDEESRLPSGNDQSYCQKLYTNFDTPAFKDYFKKPRFSNAAFTIVHYAHDVQYESDGFLDKNKDTVPDEHLKLLQDSEFEFLSEVLEKAALANPPPPVENKRMSMIARKPTLGFIFKQSLISLMDTIGETNVHYIRCIKPNEAKVAWEFEPNMVLSQLRACGVLETIRISCAGYPSRWTFEEFADRYYSLVSSQHWDPSNSPDLMSLCSAILKKSITDEDKYQIGTTKIFFRAGQLAYLEKLRADRWNECAIVLQKNIRRYIYRSRYLRIREMTLKLQCVARTRIAIKALQRMHENKAAIAIQTNWRRHNARKQYVAQKHAAVKIQTAFRGYNARKEFTHLRQEGAALKIQRMARGWLARKNYQKQRRQIVLVQSCVRRRQARKALLALKLEAKSVTHFKEVSYKLESKVVELTQNLTQQKDEKKKMADKASQLEVQLKTWMDKYEKMEKKAKGYEATLQEPKVPKADWEKLQGEKDDLHSEHQSVVQKLKSHEQTISKLQEELEQQKVENEKLREEVKAAMEKPVDDANTEELKSQIASLKSQLAQTLNAPRRQPSNNNLRSPSPAPDRMRGISPPPPASFEKETDNSGRGRSPSGLPVSRKVRRNSSAELTKGKPKTSIDNIRQTELHLKNHRPTSVDHFSTLLGSKHDRIVEEPDGDPEEGIHTILTEEENLLEEIVDGLIKELKMPLPSLQNPPSQKEVLFPAHMIGLCVTQMWKLGYTQPSERLLLTVMDTIQKQCMAFSGDEAVVPCAFWLSNVHELLSIICNTELAMEQEMRSNGKRTSAWQEFERMVSTIKYELQCLEDNVFHAWMKELKKRLSKMIVPSIVESQSLPGFITSDSGRFLNKLLAGGSSPTYSMDDLLNFLNKVWRAMKCYYLEQSVSRQVLTELLKLLGASAFNDLLMRKNFCSWKRAMQIQYNITRIEEWCKSHDIPEGTLQLEHLMQATKLLQLKKATLGDIEIIYDVCWMLTPTQIQKLISQYYVADYENPISHEILKVVASHVITGDKNDILLLDSVSIDDTTTPFDIPPAREVVAERFYLPAWLNLRRLRKLTVLVQQQLKQQQQK